MLVALGKFEEGLQLLRKSMEDAHAPRSKADNACYIAMAFAQAGKRDEAIKYLQLARQLDNKSPLLPRAEMAVRRRPAHLPTDFAQNC